METMQSLPLIDYILIVLAVFAVAWPGARIVRRTGRSGMWVVLWFIPVAGVIALWVFAYVSWPAVDRQGQAN
ncbi:MAG TPA: hypothetical protein VLX09_09685 [Stellaceae bacterium]|nr:hypothetical protein [Stellaceae bacterium]